MTDSDSSYYPSDLDAVDPAAGGDPFVRNRYHYGMLLGAEDFLVEQRGHLLRDRLHQALLHGFGTVRGLEVVGRGEPPTEIVVGQGIAVDPLGRNLFVDQLQCYDLAALRVEDLDGFSRTPHVALLDFEPEEGPAWWGFVTLRYTSCVSAPVPSVQDACTAPNRSSSYSRIHDHFELDLLKEPPAPSSLHPELSAALAAHLDCADGVAPTPPLRSPSELLAHLPTGLPEHGEQPVDGGLAEHQRGAHSAPRVRRSA